MVEVRDGVEKQLTRRLLRLALTTTRHQLQSQRVDTQLTPLHRLAS